MTENVTYCDEHVSSRKCIFFVVNMVSYNRHRQPRAREGGELTGVAVVDGEVMTHKDRGFIVFLPISKSVEPNEEQEEMTSGFQQGILCKH